MDWGDGTYELTAAALLRASSRAIEVADLRPGRAVLDLGCGTGNAAIEAARKGAAVVAVDPSARLVEVCRARALEAGLALEAKEGDASAIPVADASVDVVLSVFAVLFAPDPARAAAEMMRVVRPGGRLVLTTWIPRGAIAEAGMLLRRAHASLAPPPAGPTPRWGDPAWLDTLFAPFGAAITCEEASLDFDMASPEAWFDEQEAHHPIWRGVHRALSDKPEVWRDVRERSIAILTEGGRPVGDGFRVASPYLVVTVRRP